MGLLVSGFQSLVANAPLFFQKKPCLEERIAKVMSCIREQFPKFLETTEMILGRNIGVIVMGGSFKVTWNLDQSSIRIGREYSETRDETGLLFDFLFEMQNAQYSEIFKTYYSSIQSLEVQDFVKYIEWTEWRTLVKTLGRFQEKGLTIDENFYSEYFELFYLQQQLEGHSQQIAQRYDDMGGLKGESYQLTWKVPFEIGTNAQKYLKSLVFDYFEGIKNVDKSVNWDKAITTLKTNPRADLDRKALGEALENFEWFLKKHQSLVAETQS